jgi:hypothetical protein
VELHDLSVEAAIPTDQRGHLDERPKSYKHHIDV